MQCSRNTADQYILTDEILHFADKLPLIKRWFDRYDQYDTHDYGNCDARLKLREPFNNRIITK